MSKFTAVAYYGGIPPNNNNPEKPLILDNFCKGVSISGDNIIAHRGMNVIESDVAFIQGFVHDDGKNLPHLQLRKNAIEMQRRNNKKSLIVDSNLFLYADPGNSNRYLRYSFNGVFPTTGFYFNSEINPDRWNSISSRLGLKLKPYRTSGDHILICLQRNGGWSMRGLSTIDWLNQTIMQIRKYSNRPIVVRSHPGDKKIKRLLKISHPNCRLSLSERLTDDLRGAWATVVYNSSPSVASLIEGIPTFLTDPQPQHSQSYPLANTDLSALESPKLPERQNWIESLAMSHWNFEELSNGTAWQFFRKFI